ncbi:MAG: YbhN family protein [Candidatus Nanopelagicales bacterium]
MSGTDIQEAASHTRVSPIRIVVSAFLGVAVIALVVWFIDQNAATYEEAITELTTIPTAWIAVLVVAALINIVVYPFTVLVAVPGLSYWQGFVERQSGFLVSNAVPGGGAVAVGTQYAILNRYQVSPALSAAAVSADAVWTYLLTLGMPSLGVALLVLEGRTNGHLTGIAIIGLIAFIVSLVVIVLVVRSEAGARRVGTWGQAVVDRVFRVIKRDPPDVVTAAVDFHDSAHDLISRKWVALTVTNVAAQATPFLVLVCALAGIGVFPDQVSLIEAFAAYSAAILLTSFPLTPGGLGTVDIALIGLLVAFGATPGQAAAADVIWRLFWFLPQLVVGLVAFLGYLVARRRHPSP